MENKQNGQIEFIPTFKNAFYAPRYWGVWLGIGAIAAAAWIPPRLRDPVLGALGRAVGRVAHKARFRAQVNLAYCLPEIAAEQRETIIDDMFACVTQSTILMAELACRDPQRVLARVRWHGDELLNRLQEEGRNVIFLVPHGWAVDVPAMLMAARGQKMAAMFHNQRNELVDYMWNRVRRRFGGRMHARNDGIKPFISSVRQGSWGYYLPDQDHGAEHSEFVDFFATYKATLPAIGRLMKVCRATVVPLFPVYDGNTSLLHIHILTPMEALTDADAATVARRMNEAVETLVRPNPEQYTWVLKLLKTRKPGDPNPYKRPSR
ncbi:Lipid A biosynthesis (KDO) 2-(lauroyl)-lipid IVA acyltransferase [Candidatus Sodalis pierantonius str. SOPE]|uniref:Lipid A biosynthesis acyltransferase n=1 Tax=Candidatus Sodalis pierantonii str. SOPE TaxID=2342 RepID=W0HK86_9GAMM|nr:lauroyl-Kdo(2)-lipid IV(A) myristoyltransferase [Candidatus Sodalis pierantonius]AHF74281.1 Lipid A biosynthesis (KDO) 2-(lauroyl)-lipid IVA acyltransferase [Candidatus Sodalis pierantonius str. SOPE]